MNRSQRGMALLVVMVIVTLVALAAYGFNQQMTDAYRLSQLQIERAQARLTAMSAIEALRLSLEQPRGTRLTWHRDAPESFAAVPLEPPAGVTGESESHWAFSVISPADHSAAEIQMESPKAWRFGLSNESAKINLLVLNEWELAEPGQAAKALMNLPGFEPATARALMRAYGINDSAPAGATGLSDRTGAFTSDGVPDTGAEAARGDNNAAEWTRQWAMLWTGGDWDQNYQLDSLELSLMGEQNRTGHQGSMADQTGRAEFRQDSFSAATIAWRDYLTFDSGQTNENLAGNPRVFLNGEDLQKLHQDLLAIWPADWANFVIAARQFGVRGNRSSSGGSSVISASEWTPDFSIPAAERIASSFELVGATVEIPQSKEKALHMRSPFSDDFGDRSNYSIALADDVTVHPGSIIVGQIDVMDAPRPVLLGVPGMTPETADQIIERRASPAGSVSPTGTGDSRDTIAWLLNENVVDLPTFIKLQPWISVGGDCYHAQIVAFRDPLTPTFRCTVTLDGSGSRVTVRNFRQWDAWGRGFNIDELRGELSPKNNMDYASSRLP